MGEKLRILDALGERGLIVPPLINKGLAANDRAKYYLTLLQTAASSAALPAAERVDLKHERVAAGEPDAALDEVIAGTHALDGTRVALPGCAALFERLKQAISEMAAPLEAAGDEAAAIFAGRIASQFAQPWTESADVASRAAIARAASAAADADSPHRIVMDLHKALNRLQAQFAVESIGGARAYLVPPEDRALVAAFMRGVERTRALKFDHPGLATTATRAGARLVLQNDIGTTDAHVVVVHVEGSSATVTYTDVHLPRLVFFKRLLERWPLVWGDTISKSDSGFEDGGYHLAVGTYQAADRRSLEAYLEHLGSRLVFLIDWNRARKRLRLLVGKKDAARLMKWAADEDIGHMGFLAIGGERVVYEALASLGKPPAGFGARLDDVLGRDGAMGLLKFIFRVAVEALRDGRPQSLVHDEVRAELLGSLLSSRQSALDYASEQIAFGIEIAAALRDSLLEAGSGAQELARRARKWEHGADELVGLARELARRSQPAAEIARLVERGDDAIDALEEAAFHLSLLQPLGGDTPFLGPLTDLAGLALASAQEYLKAIEGARDLGRSAPRADVQEFLQAVHRVVELEGRGDEAERAVHAALARAASDARQLFVATEVARGLEDATDLLSRNALALRDHVLGDVMAA